MVSPTSVRQTQSSTLVGDRLGTTTPKRVRGERRELGRERAVSVVFAIFTWVCKLHESIRVLLFAPCGPKSVTSERRSDVLLSHFAFQQGRPTERKYPYVILITVFRSYRQLYRYLRWEQSSGQVLPFDEWRPVSPCAVYHTGRAPVASAAEGTTTT